MNLKNKTKAQLIDEIETLRQRIAEQEQKRREDQQTASKMQSDARKMHILIEHTPAIIFEINKNDEIIYMNRAPAGMDLAQIIGRNMYRFMNPAYHEAVKEKVRSVFETGRPSQYETAGIGSNGEEAHYNSRIAALPNEQGQIKSALIMTDDITSRKLGEQTVRDSEAKHRALFETMVQGVVYQAADGMITSANAAAARILGLTLDQMQGRTSIDPRWRAVHADGSDFPGETHPAMVALSTGKPVKNVMMGVFNPKKEGYTWINVNAIPQFKAGETAPYQCFTTFEDITERKQAEEALRESEERMRSILKSLDDLLFVFDEQGIYLDYYLPEGRFDELLLSPQEFIGKPYADLLPPIVTEKADAAFAALRKVDTIQSFDYMLEISGKSQWFSARLSSMKDDSGRLRGVVMAVRNTTESKLAKTARHESEAKLSAAFASSPVGLSITAPGGEFIEVNEAFCRTVGYARDELIGKTALELTLLNPVDHAHLMREMQQSHGVISNAEFQFIARDGNLRDVLYSVDTIQLQGVPHALATTLDITQHKQLSEEKTRQDRLAAVGQLAAGIAHDFNNLLATIIVFAQLVQYRSNLTEEDNADLSKIVQQSKKAADLIRQILDFSRQTDVKMQPLDLKANLNETIAFIERTIPESIRIQLEFERGNHIINADPTRLQQVITNLAVNAHDAMPDGGRLHFNLSHFSLAPDETPPCPDMEAGVWSKLTITDTGSGIAPEAMSHIFEPFFTTKEVGKGTGLGLAQVYGIVKQHNGHITVNSQAGQGTTFTLYFPAHIRQMPSKNKKADAPIAKGRGETILLVEDEEILLNITRAMLQTLDYRVLVAKDGVEALAVYRSHADQIDLLLTDLVMPDMGGAALVSALQAEVPNLRALMMSGYSSDWNFSPEIMSGRVSRLNKPFDIPQLAQAIRDALE